MMATTEAQRKSFDTYRAAGSDVLCVFLVTLRGLELPRRLRLLETQRLLRHSW